jgi:hypothetical protein
MVSADGGVPACLPRWELGYVWRPGGDAAFYIGACPDCNAILDPAHAQNSAEGYSGTNSRGRLIIQNSEFDHNNTGFSTNSQNNDDQPSPQSGHCPGNETGPTGTQSCWLFTHNSVHDNNNANVPFSPADVGVPVGTGVLISGGRFDTVADNDIHDNGAWGVLLVPEVDTATPPPGARCTGGIGLAVLCYFDDWGNEIENNTLSHNGFFGNPSNVDLAEISNLEFPGNCWHGRSTPRARSSAPGTFSSAAHGSRATRHSSSPSPTALAESRTRANRSFASSVWRSPATPSSSAPARAPRSRTIRARRRSN